MTKILPILSGSLRGIIRDVAKNNNPIADELLFVDALVDQYNNIVGISNTDVVLGVLLETINSRITDEVRMLSVRLDELQISFLPKDKNPEYKDDGNWSRKNRQTGKPARIIQKLLKTEYKTRDWEIFTNLFKAASCQCLSFELVSGEDIVRWYNHANYFKEEGTLGNSCMRYSGSADYLTLYVENAKMLITTKNGLLTGRAIVWEVDGVVIMDRVYTCFDYLENCFYDYAKTNKWWVRSSNSLLSTGDEQRWYSPDDDYQQIRDRTFTIDLKASYDIMPYVDSFRYYDGERKLSNSPYGFMNLQGLYTLDNTDGEMDYVYIHECESCGKIVLGNEDESIVYSDYEGAYYCTDCSYYCEDLDDYFSFKNNPPLYVDCSYADDLPHPPFYVEEHLVTNKNITCPLRDTCIVQIDDHYYCVDSPYIRYNEELKKYEKVRSHSL